MVAAALHTGQQQIDTAPALTAAKCSSGPRAGPLSYAIRDRGTGAPLVLRLCQIASVIAGMRWATRMATPPATRWSLARPPCPPPSPRTHLRAYAVTHVAAALRAAALDASSHATPS